MTLQSLLLILLGGVLANNIALGGALGVAPFLGYTRKGAKTAAMGVAVTLVMLLSTAIVWPVQAYLLAPRGLEYLQTLVLVVVILILVYGADAVARSAFDQGPKLYAPAIALNSAVFGATVNGFASAYGEALVAALGAGLGFLLGMLALSALRARIQQKDVPAAFRGLPILLVAASIVAMALMAFK